MMTVEGNWSQVKKTLEWFQSVMLGKMAANTFKGDWLTAPTEALRARLREECIEFYEAKKPASQIQELGDVANICMMLADKIAHEENQKAST